ncbi:MAG TPA: hypothetical protein PKE69_25055 [Pyrinomonadaceae bacterium]|nr:hypothetical protein [Pyrinomonadaceae bacterium]
MNLLYGLVALISFIAAGYLILSGGDAAAKSMTPLIIGVVLIVIGIVCGGLFLAGRVNKTEDIHITE